LQIKTTQVGKNW